MKYEFEYGNLSNLRPFCLSRTVRIPTQRTKDFDFENRDKSI